MAEVDTTQDNDHYDKNLNSDAQLVVGDADGDSRNNVKTSRSYSSIIFSMVKDLCIFYLTYICLFSPPWIVVSNRGLGSTLRTQGPASPKPFFDWKSNFVDDYFTGDIYSAFEQAQDYENALFMFYAPWDVDSLEARKVLDEVAEQFRDLSGLYVASVNCWTSVGTCYKEFGAGKKKNQPPQGIKGTQNHFPIFVFYPKTKRGIQYNGPITVAHLTDFVDNMQRPMAVVRDKEEFMNLRIESGGRTIVGYFPNLTASNLNMSYRRFLHSSYEFLEVDPFREEIAKFVVVTSPKLAFQLQLNQQQPIRYFHWNSTSFVYPNRTITSYKSFMRWCLDKSEDNLSSWTGTRGRKSLLLSQHLAVGSGYSLLMFLPRLPQHDYNIKLSLLQEIALRYKTCPGSQDPNVVYHMHLSRIAKHLELQETVKSCLSDPLFHLTFCTKSGYHSKHCLCQDTCNLNRTLLSPSSLKLNKNFFPSYVREESFKTPDSFNGIFGDSNVFHMKQRSKLLSCSRLFQKHNACDVMNRITNSYLDGSDDMEKIIAKIDGLGCSSNKSLNFYFLDSKTQEFLGKSIGVDPEEGIAIIDLHTERSFTMAQDKFSIKNAVDLIFEFHNSPDRLPKLSLDSKPKTNIAKGDAQSRLRFHEVSSSNFEETVMNQYENVVLFYSSSSCGLCSSYAHIFHTVKSILTPAASNLTFVGVDSGKNDLPTQFTALQVPSILFFPQGDANAKAETRAFPSHKPLNVPNLLSFVLANLPKEMRLQLSVSLCDDDCVIKTRMELSKKLLDSPGEEEKMFLKELDKILQSESESRLDRTRFVQPEVPSPERLPEVDILEEAKQGSRNIHHKKHEL